MAMSAASAFANVHRHWTMHREAKRGEFRRISGTPFTTSIFFFLGVWIAPVTWAPWMILVLLAEGPAFITIIPRDADGGGGTEESGDTGEAAAPPAASGDVADAPATNPVEEDDRAS